MARFFINSKIIGIDKDDKSNLNNENLLTYIVDQSNKESLLSFKNKINNKFDIIIDDGSHREQDILLSFDVLWDKVSNGGFYCIEDTNCDNAIKEIIYNDEFDIKELYYNNEITKTILNKYNNLNYLNIKSLTVYPSRQNHQCLIIFQKDSVV